MTLYQSCRKFGGVVRRYNMLYLYMYACIYIYIYIGRCRISIINSMVPYSQYCTSVIYIYTHTCMHIYIYMLVGSLVLGDGGVSVALSLDAVSSPCLPTAQSGPLEIKSTRLAHEPGLALQDCSSRMHRS